MMPPYIKIITDDLPPNVGGDAWLCRVRIRPKHKDDLGIIAHEEEHVKQWYVGLAIGVIAAIVLALSGTQWTALWPIVVVFGVGLHPTLYTLLPAYRLWSEVVAYRIQAAHYPDDRRHLFATFIAEDYGLSITPSTAEARLRR